MHYTVSGIITSIGVMMPEINKRKILLAKLDCIWKGKIIIYLKEQNMRIWIRFIWHEEAESSDQTETRVAYTAGNSLNSWTANNCEGHCSYK